MKRIVHFSLPMPSYGGSTVQAAVLVGLGAVAAVAGATVIADRVGGVFEFGSAMIVEAGGSVEGDTVPTSLEDVPPSGAHTSPEGLAWCEPVVVFLGERPVAEDDGDGVVGDPAEGQSGGNGSSGGE